MRSKMVLLGMSRDGNLDFFSCPASFLGTSFNYSLPDSLLPSSRAYFAIELKLRFCLIRGSTSTCKHVDGIRFCGYDTQSFSNNYLLSSSLLTLLFSLILFSNFASDTKSLKDSPVLKTCDTFYVRYFSAPLSRLLA